MLKEVTTSSKKDLWSYYHQLRTKENDILKTVSQTLYRHYEMLVTPFRFANVITAFMDIKSRVFIKYFDKFVIVSLMTF